jgi:hypothetical protein
VEAYCHLFGIETGLRELIIETLDRVAGPTWYKTRLPGDVLAKYREGLKYERDAKWIQVVPHHPIYYTDFADLRKIIERSDNWSKAFEQVFGRKDLIASTLSELEVIRNKIAHNRKATDGDLAMTKSCLTKLSEAIGAERFASLVGRCTCAPDILESLRALREEGRAMFACCSECKPVPHLRVWASARESWWFDESYLDNSLEEICKFFQALEGYAALPHGRGSGYMLEAWFKAKDVAGLFVAAEKEFSALIANSLEVK